MRGSWQKTVTTIQGGTESHSLFLNHTQAYSRWPHDTLRCTALNPQRQPLNADAAALPHHSGTIICNTGVTPDAGTVLYHPVPDRESARGDAVCSQGGVVEGPGAQEILQAACSVRTWECVGCDLEDVEVRMLRGRGRCHGSRMVRGKWSPRYTPELSTRCMRGTRAYPVACPTSLFRCGMGVRCISRSPRLSLTQ